MVYLWTRAALAKGVHTYTYARRCGRSVCHPERSEGTISGMAPFEAEAQEATEDSERLRTARG
jgi:hypothetical protein